MKTANIIFSFVLLFVFVIALSFPRFNQQNLFGLNKIAGQYDEYNIVRGYHLSGDAVDYLLCVKYYRGETDRGKLNTPFVYRFLVPYLASLLPVNDALTSLNVMNIILFLCSIVLFYFTLKALNFSKSFSVIGCYMLGISFFTFYYLTMGLIESGFIFFYVVGLYSIFKRNDFLFLIALTLGALAKEFTLILIPTYFIYNYIFKQYKPNKLIFYSAIFILPLTAIAIVRIQFNDLPSYIWTPAFDLFFTNLFRTRAYIAPLLVLGIPGLISIMFVYLYFVKKYKMEYDINLSVTEQYNYQKFFVAIFFFSMFLWVYGFMSAVADGRSFMPSFITSIFITLMVAKYLYTRYQLRDLTIENNPILIPVSKEVIKENTHFIITEIEKPPIRK
ncbi:MAG TPA: hypothetical protein VHP32_12085 [Ignavibacteria bacterium]|nr:hypothetical protein [Ignavibacteria bacterium]